MDIADDEPRREEAPEEGETNETPAHLDPLAAKDLQISDLTNDLKRLQAEFDNHKKRTEKEWGERSRVATQRLVADLLPVLDSFDKAMETASKGSKKELQAGLEGIHKQLLQALQREGLKEIPARGKFDPFLHEALMREEREDLDDGQIMEVFQKGYMLGQKVLRPTRVKVSKRKEAEPTPEVQDQHADQESADEENQNQQR
ncbi:MAG: nucleotide exchange factor GrpE [Thermoplasmata archaeon]|nr:nucleotide exchange factor GrpE [Thermoplasmata archaeon]